MSTCVQGWSGRRQWWDLSGPQNWWLLPVSKHIVSTPPPHTHTLLFWMQRKHSSHSSGYANSILIYQVFSFVACSSMTAVSRKEKQPSLISRRQLFTFLFVNSDQIYIFFLSFLFLFIRFWGNIWKSLMVSHHALPSLPPPTCWGAERWGRSSHVGESFQELSFLVQLLFHLIGSYAEGPRRVELFLNFR